MAEQKMTDREIIQKYKRNARENARELRKDGWGALFLAISLPSALYVLGGGGSLPGAVPVPALIASAVFAALSGGFFLISNRWKRRSTGNFYELELNDARRRMSTGG